MSNLHSEAANLRRLRSGVTNGRRRFIDDVDGRSPTARRHRDLIDLFKAEVGRDDLATSSLIQRAASLQVLLESADASIAAGEAESRTLGDYAKASGTLFRVLRSLGLVGLGSSSGTSTSNRKLTPDELWDRHRRRGSQ